MSRHIFLTPDGVAHSRWREAFPALITLDHVPQLGFPYAGDVVWIASELPGALTVIADLHRRSAAAALIMISLQPDEDEALEAFEAGARGYCHAWATPALLQQVGLVVANGGLWIGAELMGRVITATRKLLPSSAKANGNASVRALLTERERQVAEAVSQGLTNKEVAKTLDITERTVKAHLGMVFEKLGIRDRLQLVLHFSGVRDVARLSV